MFSIGRILNVDCLALMKVAYLQFRLIKSRCDDSVDSYTPKRALRVDNTAVGKNHLRQDLHIIGKDKISPL